MTGFTANRKSTFNNIKCLQFFHFINSGYQQYLDSTRGLYNTDLALSKGIAEGRSYRGYIIIYNIYVKIN